MNRMNRNGSLETHGEGEVLKSFRVVGPELPLWQTEVLIFVFSESNYEPNESLNSLPNEVYKRVRITQGLGNARQALYHGAKTPVHPHIPLNISNRYTIQLKNWSSHVQWQTHNPSN